MSHAEETAPPIISRESYWSQSRRPLTSLVFVAPLLVVYEVGVLMMGAGTVRNGADVWLRELLQAAGFGQYLLLPLLTVCILLGWHYTTRQPWRFSPRVLWGMLTECLILAFLLRLILLVQGALLPVASISAGDVAESVVGYLGAGVYEELLFRLIFLSALCWTLRRCGMRRLSSTTVAVLATSLAFASAHYVGPHGEGVDFIQATFWFGFIFRFLAGVFFSVLYACRGFGVAAGAHAGYDILVGVL